MYHNVCDTLINLNYLGYWMFVYEDIYFEDPIVMVYWTGKHVFETKTMLLRKTYLHTNPITYMYIAYLKLVLLLIIHCF